MNQTRIRKAIIPAAGFGTRFLPITKTVPKEMLPVGDKPVIQYVVEEAVAAGLTEILIVISRGKEAIPDYFARNPELERRLEASGKAGLAAGLRRLSEMARIHYIYQHEMKGLGHAVLQGRSFAGDEPFGLLLGDTFISPAKDPEAQSTTMTRLVETLNERKTSAVAVEPVSPERVARYGVAGGEEIKSGLFQVREMVEKPEPASAPLIRRLSDKNGSFCHYAFAARYVFTSGLFAELERTTPGKNGEIQLTDAMTALKEKEGFHAVELDGIRRDIGDPEGLRNALNSLKSEPAARLTVNR